MSTRSIIYKDGKGVYCHYDGYLDGVGKVLQENYLDSNKTEQLISNGWISSLGEEIGEKHPFAPYDLIPKGAEKDEREKITDAYYSEYGHMTTFYKRDRGDEYVDHFAYDSQDDLLAHAPNEYNAEYLYVYENNEWQVASKETNWVFKLLRSQLLENGIEFKEPEPTPTSTTVQLGKIDATNNGIKDNAVDIKIELEDGKFTASGSIWNRLHSDIISGGQNLDEIAKNFPDNVTVAKIHTIWKNYHLNDMNAGTQLQEDWISTQKSIGNLEQNASYEDICEALKSHGLYEVEHLGEPYKYGSAWITQEIPQSIQDEIKNIIVQNHKSSSSKSIKSKNQKKIDNAINNTTSF